MGQYLLAFNNDVNEFISILYLKSNNQEKILTNIDCFVNIYDNETLIYKPSEILFFKLVVLL